MKTKGFGQTKIKLIWATIIVQYSNKSKSNQLKCKTTYHLLLISLNQTLSAKLKSWFIHINVPAEFEKDEGLCLADLIKQSLDHFLFLTTTTEITWRVIIMNN